MSECTYVDFELAVAVCQGEGFVIRDAGLLGSAVARPRMTVMGIDAYPAPQTKAAALLHSVAGNHCLLDGNKRLAWLLTTVFLDLNGHGPELGHEAAYELVMAVADGTLRDVSAIADRLPIRAH